MGIQGLLPFLQPIQKATHLKHFKGKTIGVDAYVWLHRGAYACTAELVLGTPTTKYVDFAMSRVRLLEHNGANPLIVFDGGPLPAKKPTDEKRKMQRKEALGQARAFNAQGRHSQARELYGKALDVTPEVAYQFIKALKAAGVPYIVAPYEADAQLAFLSKSGIIDAVLTEDSDLLVFGVQEALFKLDASGTCMRVSRADFGLAELGMTGWDMSRFREMAMLSGCDYLPNIPGMGLKTAHKMIKKYHNVEKVLTAVRFEGKRRIPSDYLVRFRMAERAFLHQRVWDPSQGRLVCLEDLPEGDVQAAMDAADLADAGDDAVDPDAYIGRDLEPTIARGVAEGSLCPVTYEPIRDINPAFRPGQRQNLLLSSTSSIAKSTSAAAAPKPTSKGMLTAFFKPSSSASAAVVKGKEVLKPVDVNKSAATPRKGTLEGFLTPVSGSEPEPRRSASQSSLASRSVITTTTPIFQPSPYETSGVSTSTPKQAAVNPRARGKRTLVELMDEERAASTPSSGKAKASNSGATSSALFAATLTQSTPTKFRPNAEHPISAPAAENIVAFDDDDEVEEIDADLFHGHAARQRKRARLSAEEPLTPPEDKEMVLDPVEQEAGYLSPGALSDHDISSPVHPAHAKQRERSSSVASIISSPSVVRTRHTVELPNFESGGVRVGPGIRRSKERSRRISGQLMREKENLNNVSVNPTTVEEDDDSGKSIDLQELFWVGDDMDDQDEDRAFSVVEDGIPTQDEDAEAVTPNGPSQILDDFKFTFARSQPSLTHSAFHPADDPALLLSSSSEPDTLLRDAARVKANAAQVADGWRTRFAMRSTPQPTKAMDFARSEHGPPVRRDALQLHPRVIGGVINSVPSLSEQFSDEEVVDFEFEQDEAIEDADELGLPEPAPQHDFKSGAAAFAHFRFHAGATAGTGASGRR